MLFDKRIDIVLDRDFLMSVCQTINSCMTRKLSTSICKLGISIRNPKLTSAAFAIICSGLTFYLSSRPHSSTSPQQYNKRSFGLSVFALLLSSRSLRCIKFRFSSNEFCEVFSCRQVRQDKFLPSLRFLFDFSLSHVFE